MLKLAKDFYLISIFKNNHSNLKKVYYYKFMYKNYQIALNIRFYIDEYTKDSNIPIIIFTYTVYIKKWSNKYQDFYYIHDMDFSCGKSTKRYLDSREARELILRFVEKRVDKYLNLVSPSIFIRSLSSEKQIILPRYKRLDKQFFKNGYFKKEFYVDTSESFYDIVDEKSDEVIWVYSKDEALLDRLEKLKDLDDI